MFANDQVMGRSGALAFAALGKKAGSPGGSGKMDENLRQYLKWWSTT